MHRIGWIFACAFLAANLSENFAHAGEEKGVRESTGNGTRVPVVPDNVGLLHENFGTLFRSSKNDQEERVLQEGRTFGHKRIQFLLMPMMYKMGAMMTLLAVLTVISLKGLLVGTALLVLKLSTILAKFFSSGWHSHQAAAWPAAAPQPVHVHLHNTHGHGQAYSGWAPPSGPDDDHYFYKG